MKNRPRDERLGVCLIGRNEGARLGAAIEAVIDRGAHRVYVDSQSSDGSPELAEGFGDALEVVRLGPEVRCTAALGRNEGFKVLRQRVPDLQFVQFVDGDCVLVDGWLDTAVAYLDAHPDVALVAGRLREDDRERNIYHRLADMEWDVPPGEAQATGGICMVRAEAYERVGGFDAAVAQGEEAELARRLQEHGYRIVRLGDEMALHDIGMDRFSQWWRRTVREGEASAESVFMRGLQEPAELRHLLSMLAWGAGLPSAALLGAPLTLGASLGLLAGYPVLWRRVRRDRLARGARPDDARLYASAVVAGKLANAVGVGKFTTRVLRGQVRHGRHLA